MSLALLRSAEHFFLRVVKEYLFLSLNTLKRIRL